MFLFIPRILEMACNLRKLPGFAPLSKFYRVLINVFRIIRKTYIKRTFPNYWFINSFEKTFKCSIVATLIKKCKKNAIDLFSYKNVCSKVSLWQQAIYDKLQYLNIFWLHIFGACRIFNVKQWKVSFVILNITAWERKCFTACVNIHSERNSYNL